MVLFIRDNECFEPRVKNYLYYFQEKNIDYHVIAWNRKGDAIEDEHITFFDRRAEYGKRIRNIPNKIAWMLFVMKKLIQHRKKYHAIHACDIDAVIPALIVGKILRKKVIFDIFDWISSLTGKGMVYRIVEVVQNLAYKYSDYVILCEEERKKQARAKKPNVYVLPNIPNDDIAPDEKTLEITEKDLNNYPVVVSYVGVFDRDRGLENLLKCISKKPDILLNIAGFGVLEDLIRKYADRYPNIVLWGRVDYAVGQAIMKNSSLIAAMYYLTSPLHKYAAPNKYYESLELEVPVVTTRNTLVGSKVRRYDTGFVLDETLESLNALFEDDKLQEKIDKKKKNCHKVWNEIYSHYFASFMDGQYMEMIR